MSVFYMINDWVKDVRLEIWYLFLMSVLTSL